MRSLDIRSMIQPFSFLLVSKAFREIQAGETLEILLGSPNAVKDLLKILPPSSYVMLLMEKCQGNDDGIRLQLKKTTVLKDGTGMARAAKPTPLTIKGE